MATIPWLAEVLRAAGVSVVGEGDWQNRMRPGDFNPIGVLWHHTAATSSASNPHPALNVCINGRPDLPGPLCHALVDYFGVFHLISAGRANHAGVSGGSGPIPQGDGNTMLIGWEIDYQGVDQRMTAAQYDASIAATAAVLERLGRSSSYARGHRETSVTGKIDPGHVNLDTMRADVDRRMRGTGTDSVGFWNRSDGTWHLNNGTDGASDRTFTWGPVNQSWAIPLVGDWNGSGRDSVGFWNRSDGTWHLTNDGTGGSDYAFEYGPVGRDWAVPLVGDWNGDGVDSVGFWNRSDGSWHLNNNRDGSSDRTFTWGPVNQSWAVPLVGDWNGSGRDSVGFWNRSDGTWHLTNDGTGGSDYAFQWGPVNKAWAVPLVGDWNGDGRDSVGYWNRSDGTWHLTNDNTGASDVAFTYGPVGRDWAVPLVGNWDAR